MIDSIEFLKKHNYIVSVKELKDGLEVKFPELKTRFIVKPARTITYLIKRGKNPKLTIKESGEVVKIPEYAIRLYIGSLITKHCIEIGYNFDYLVVYDRHDKELGLGIEKVEEIMKAPKVNTEKEELLIDMFNKCGEVGIIESFDNIAKDLGISEGFALIKSLVSK